MNLAPSLFRHPTLAVALCCFLSPTVGAERGWSDPGSDVDEVERLQSLLRDYYNWEEQYTHQRLTPAERQARERADREARRLADLAYDSGKVRLNGAEGSLLLAKFTRRLYNPEIPEISDGAAPTCTIQTYLLGNLIAGEKQSFQSVGKYHYLLKEPLQPGETTVRITGHSWTIRIPDDSSTQDYLLALYHPPDQAPELHAFPVEELLSTRDVHLPPWLPDALQLNPRG